MVVAILIHSTVEVPKTLKIKTHVATNTFIIIKKSLRLVSNNKVDICVLVRLALRCTQAEK